MVYAVLCRLQKVVPWLRELLLVAFGAWTGFYMVVFGLLLHVVFAFTGQGWWIWRVGQTKALSLQLKRKWTQVCHRLRLPVILGRLKKRDLLPGEWAEWYGSEIELMVRPPYGLTLENSPWKSTSKKENKTKCRRWEHKSSFMLFVSNLRLLIFYIILGPQCTCYQAPEMYTKMLRVCVTECLMFSIHDQGNGNRRGFHLKHYSTLRRCWR